MDGSPLDQAYTASKHADAAVRSGDFAQAATYYTQSAEAYERVAGDAGDNPAVGTLVALAGQCRARARYFESGQALEDAKKTASSAGSAAGGTARTGSPAPARQPPPPRAAAAQPPAAPPAHQPGSGSVLAPPPMASSVVAAPLGDALTGLMMRSAAAFTRTFEQSLAGKGAAMPSLSSAPTESFYLVRPKTGKQDDDDVAPGRFTISTIERAQAIERATKAQRAVLKTGLQQIRHDMAQKEQQLQDEHTEEVDRLRAENDRLRIQVSKLKSRWEELKESARKRQA